MAVHDSYLTVNSLVLDLDGFCQVRSLLPLLEQGALRGDDFTSLGVDGDTFQARSQGAHKIALDLTIYGNKSSAGATHTDQWKGLYTNVAQIYTSCVTGSKAAAVTATLTFADASTISGSVVCTELTLQRIADYSTAVIGATLRMKMLGGKLS